MKSDRLIGSFFFNVMHLSLVQTVLYKQHYIKHNAIKLTFACLAAIFGGSFWRQNGGLWFDYQNKIHPSAKILFDLFIQKYFCFV